MHRGVIRTSPQTLRVGSHIPQFNEEVATVSLDDCRIRHNFIGEMQTVTISMQGDNALCEHQKGINPEIIPIGQTLKNRNPRNEVRVRYGWLNGWLNGKDAPPYPVGNVVLHETMNLSHCHPSE